MGCTAQTRIILMRSARQRRGGGLRAHVPRPEPHAGIAFRDPLELDQQRGIVVSRQQPEEKAIGEPKCPRIGRPTQLEQTAILEDRSEFLPSHRLRRGVRQEVPPPQPRVLLFPNDGDRFLVMEKLVAQRGYTLDVARRIGHDFSERPILDGETGGLIQPRQRYRMCGGNLQPPLRW